MKYTPFAFFLLIIGCSKKEEKPTIRPSIYFNSVPSEESGLNFSNDLHYREDLNILDYLYYYNGGGVAIGDINNDGLEDIYFTANQGPDRLYLNQGNLEFKEITKASGIAIDSTWSTGVTMEDINNDGFLDIYVSKLGNYKGLKDHNLLYINNGNSTFSESSETYGLDFSGFSTQASFFDYDNDGDMDIYLLNHSIHTNRSYGKAEKHMEKDSLSGDRLYENKLNEGKAHFEDVTASSGIYSSTLGFGLGLVTSDIDQDGLVDIYVGNDFHENDYLYINQGDKTFKESGQNFMGHSSRFSMGADIADVNNDDKLDIFTLDMMPYDHDIFLKSGGEDTDKVSQIKKSFGYGTQYARNNFQLNRDNLSFSDIALMTGTYATDWSWSVLLADYDNDGLNDIFISNGIYKRPNDLDYIKYLSTVDFSVYDRTKQNDLKKKLIEGMPSLKIPNVVFHNKGNLDFEKFDTGSGLVDSNSNGAAYGDLDNDGDLDIVVNNLNDKAFLLENKSGPDAKNNYISFTLQGSDSYKNPTGSKAYLYAGRHMYMRELTATRGFQSSSSHKLHFGLGNLEKVDSLKVIWLDGETQMDRGLKINRNNLITKHSGVSKIRQKLVESIDSINIFPFTHIENTYRDFESEPLIPEKLSTEGPALVSADFNGDGLKDIFIGGAENQTSAFFVQKKNGEYEQRSVKAFSEDNIYEDVDAAPFDLDHDGDLDLYVLSGGGQSLEGSSNLEDRIYINDGNGNFKRLNSTLPKFNGGSVSAADFNGDGYDDLFIGSRSFPGTYGLSPYSLILKNTGRNSFEIVQKSQFGMITDSQWEDINNDGRLDLILVGDWMPITILVNKGDGTFTNKTEEYGLGDTQGMWNAISLADLDDDGNKDILAGNAGLNFKWKASKDRPVKMYLHDFDGNGQLDPIIFYDLFGRYVPFASKDKLTDQIPSLKKKFLSYKNFSKVSTIADLMGKAESALLETKRISELRSMAYMNHSTKFEGIPLPKEAQMSTVEDFSISLEQGKPKIVFVGNYLDYVTELGNSDANSGGVLTSFDSNGFHTYKSLDLPPNLNTRKIIKLNNNEFLVVSNNDKAYSIEISKNDGS